MTAPRDIALVLTVLVADLRGTRAHAERSGIQADLARRQRLHRFCEDAAAEHGGTVYRHVADNSYLLFRVHADAEACLGRLRESIFDLKLGLARGALVFVNGEWEGMAIIEASDQVEG